MIEKCYGFDVTDYPLPENVEFASDWKTKSVDVITFFDVLEHFDDPYMIKDLKASYISLSFPWCNYKSDAWFESWKHRKPNEHLWFFDEKSIYKFAETTGYTVINHSNIEDTIRKSTDSPNILSVVLRKN